MVPLSSKFLEYQTVNKIYFFLALLVLLYFQDQYILKMHVKMVHMPVEVLFECSVCLKKFNRKAHLKRHVRTHNPTKPFKCQLCDYRSVCTLPIVCRALAAGFYSNGTANSDFVFVHGT